MAVIGIGIDFGTTNSVVSFAHDDGHVESAEWTFGGEPTSTYRTALAFWRENRILHHVSGPAAMARAEQPSGEQRFIQSLKTHLASRAFSETRLYGTRLTIEELVALFLRDLLGDTIERRNAGGAPHPAIIAGRPVVFAGGTADPALAVDRLERAYASIGVTDAVLAYEPVGAAYWYARTLTRDETVLVADFGGGTSDFSVLRFARQADGRMQATPLAHSGIGIAGDTFDARIIEHAVAPRLGKGATYRSFDKELPIPAYIHAAFAQWHELSWLRSPPLLAELRRLADASSRRAELDDLITVLEMDMGHALHRAVAGAKADLSKGSRAQLTFSGWGVHVDVEVSRDAFEEWIASDLAAVDAAVTAALERCDLGADEIDAVFLTGGTSFVPAVRRLFDRRFDPARVHIGDAFQSVASGLALMAADRAA